MQQYFPVICGEWCLFNSLACGWDTKGGQTVLNGLDGASVESYTPEEKKKIYNAVAKVQTEVYISGYKKEILPWNISGCKKKHYLGICQGIKKKHYLGIYQ